MRNFAQFVVLLALLAISLPMTVAPGGSARADEPQQGDRDKAQPKSLFNEIRDAFPKLKDGLTDDEARRVLQIDHLTCVVLCGNAGSTTAYYKIPGGAGRSLIFNCRYDSQLQCFFFVSAELRERNRVVAKFEVSEQ